MPEYIFDVVLMTGLVLLAWRSLATRDLFKAVVFFIISSLVLSLAWTRLGAPDIALAEAAIGAGLTGALLIDAVGHLREREADGDSQQASAERQDHVD
jgi:uncharacterized MnhB-related membrane protein